MCLDILEKQRECRLEKLHIVKVHVLFTTKALFKEATKTK